MNTLKNTAMSTIISLGMLGTLQAQNIQTNKDSTNTALTENLDLKINKETETIINFMAGIIHTEEMEKIFSENNIKKQENKLILLIPDTLLYESIMELQTKYSNPNITFKWPKLIGEEYDGHFSQRKNTIEINLPNLIKYSKNNKEQTNALQYTMLDIRLSEMSHSKQDITFKKKRKDFGTLIKIGFDYDEMYETEGTIEHEAHKILEKEIINEFLEIYVSKIDITKEEEVKKADYLFEKYKYTNEKPDSNNTNLIFIIDKKNNKELEEIHRKE